MKITNKTGNFAKLTKLDYTEWDKFKKQVNPLDNKSRTKDASNGFTDECPSVVADESQKRTGINIPRARGYNRPRPLHRVPKELLEIDEKLLRKLKGGKIRIQDRLDLHGYTQQEARQRLIQFLANAQSEGYKIVLVITGKGNSKYDDSGIPIAGVLRKQLPCWLIHSDLYRFVAASSYAFQCHGGEGARYIQVRRPR